MRNYNLINNITGWVVFGIALTVYTLTLEPTASFWDCGEFIACSYKLMVPHAPGAPLFLMIGRLFTLLAGDASQVAWWMNFMSGLCSAFTSLFLFWSITKLAQKLLPKTEETPTKADVVLAMGSGVVGALAYTFTDTAWFSAGEAEVYAMSSFFTAIVFWAMLKWETKAGTATSDKWLILISYLVGLSIGVHLLNLVAIPALAFIFYFRHYSYTFKGSLITISISGFILVFILWGVIPGMPTLAGSMELFFINSLGLPFGSGIIAFVILLAAAILYSLFYSIKYKKRILNTAILCFVFVLIGYGSYLMIPIRSAYNPTIDINNPEDVMSVVSYLKREQYGDRPLLYGPQYNAQPVGQQEGAPRYSKGKDKYVKQPRIEPVYDSKDKTLLPRIYSDKPEDVREYSKWVDLRQGQMPTFAQNISFLLRYQLGHMYWRYFLWNFVGRESDVQHAGVVWLGKGNTGLPQTLLQNKARNSFYMLPLLVGILGLLHQVRKRKQDAVIVGLLFFFTGMAIALYLNQPPTEPRERDYTFAASFYAFSIWIGLGVMAMAALLRHVLKYKFASATLAGILCLAVPAVMAAESWDDHDRSDRYFSLDSAKNLLDSCAPNAILFTYADNDTYPLWYAQEVEGYRTDVRVAVMTFLNTDWYIEQMMRPAYEAAPWPLTLEMENFRQGTNDYLPYLERPQVATGIDLKQFMQLVKQNHPALQAQYGSGTTLLTFPTKDFYLLVNKQQVLEQGVLTEEEQHAVNNRMHLKVEVPYLEKRHLVVLDLLSTQNWDRPIYFSTNIPVSDYVGLQKYSRLEGFAYRIVPVSAEKDQEQVDTEVLYDNLIKKFSYRNLDDPSVYLDQNYLNFAASAREKFALLAKNYLKAGNKEKAKEAIDFCFKKIPLDTVPCDFSTPKFIPLLTAIGETERAEQLVKQIAKSTQQELDFYLAKGPLHERKVQLNMLQLQELIIAAQDSGMLAEAKQLEQPFLQYLQRMRQ
ncbi:glycosyltransferase family 117 protein [Pontibacter sp. H249]|uniref:glycosyltransferase family 117 protein n=1 Tax=Pontibacter sp. H249 TaxID=3133420 RepID=UPI0030BC3CC3